MLYRGDAINRTEFTQFCDLTDPVEMRNFAYQYLLGKEDGSALLEFEGKSITIDEANKMYTEYFAEDNPKAIELKPLIKSAKEYVRSQW